MSLADEQLNIAICKWRGWKQSVRSNHWVLNENLDTRLLHSSHLPNHLIDLNAMHEAEEFIHPNEIDQYIEELGVIVREHWISKGKQVEEFNQQAVIFAHAHATARQRAIALLRVVKPELFHEPR